MKFMGTRALDYLGGCVSTLCAVHCLLKPLLVLLPSVAVVDLLLAHSTELYLLATGVLLALVSCLWGFSKHRRPQVFYLFGTAVLLIGTGRWFLGTAGGSLPVVMGGFLIAANHILNYQLLEASH